LVEIKAEISVLKQDFTFVCLQLFVTLKLTNVKLIY